VGIPGLHHAEDDGETNIDRVRLGLYEESFCFGIVRSTNFFYARVTHAFIAAQFSVFLQKLLAPNKNGCFAQINFY